MEKEPTLTFVDIDMYHIVPTYARHKVDESLIDDLISQGKAYSIYDHVKKEAYDPNISATKAGVITGAVLTGIGALGAAIAIGVGAPIIAIGGAMGATTGAVIHLARSISKKAGWENRLTQFEEQLSYYEDKIVEEGKKR